MTGETDGQLLGMHPNLPITSSLGNGGWCVSLLLVLPNLIFSCLACVDVLR